MHIDKIRRMYPGQMVTCPEDRGSPSYVGVICGIGGETRETPNGVKYAWVTVRGLGKNSVWPSNRLQ